MNRVKLWLFTLLVVAAAFVALRAISLSMRTDALAAIDARLASAAAHVSASTRGIAHDAGAAAAMLSRDERLVAGLRATEAAPASVAALARARRAATAPTAPAANPDALEAALRETARQALANAENAFGHPLPAGTLVTAGNRDWLAAKGDPAENEGEAMAFLRGAVAGQPRRGFLRLNGGVWYGAATPVGDGAGVVLLVPLDDAWAKGLATSAGVDVTLSVPDVKPVSTARPADAPALVAATKAAGAADVGRSGDVDVSVGPVALPRLPNPLGEGPAYRARAIPLEGVKGGFVVASVPAAAAINGVGALHYQVLGGIAGVLFFGLVLGLFVRGPDSTPEIPKPLHAAAVRIEKGDFAARAPQLAGKLGTIAAALNKAAELAGPAQAALGAPAPEPTREEQFQAPAMPAAARPEPAFELPPRPAPAREPLPPEPPRAVSFGAGIAAASAAGPASAFEVDEDAHWQQVFQDFLRTRASCGEPTEALTYERFRGKLDTNKGQLVAKYGCKTVRFQVYVKDGKAALKATPVK